jgi:hypothetical protein
MDDESEEEYDQQVYVTHMEDAIWCGVSKVMGRALEHAKYRTVLPTAVQALTCGLCARHQPKG